MFADELRKRVKKDEEKQKAENKKALDDRRQKMFKDAKQILRGSARRREALVLTVTDVEDDMIDLSGCGFSSLDDTREEIRSAQGEIKSRQPQHLRGIAAELRDWLRSEGFALSLVHRVAGSGCKGSFNAWDLIARW